MLSFLENDVRVHKDNFNGITFPELKEVESSNAIKPVLKNLIIHRKQLEDVRAFVNLTSVVIDQDDVDEKMYYF